MPLSSPSFPLSGDGCPLPKICSAQIPVPPATTTVDEAQSRPAASEGTAASVYLGEAPPPLSGDRERRFCLPPATTMVARHPKFRSSLRQRRLPSSRSSPAHNIRSGYLVHHGLFLPELISCCSRSCRLHTQTCSRVMVYSGKNDGCPIQNLGTERSKKRGARRTATAPT